MSAHLSYEQCRALRDAGFPQGEIRASCQPSTEMYWFKNADGGTENIHWTDPEYVNFPNVACPNSDELLAWMQDRWPTAMLGVQYSHRFKRYRAHHAAPPYGKFNHGDGPTPVAALCALALQLAQQEATT